MYSEVVFILNGLKRELYCILVLSDNAAFFSTTLHVSLYLFSFTCNGTFRRYIVNKKYKIRGIRVLLKLIFLYFFFIFQLSSVITVTPQSWTTTNVT